jgi:phenylpropionate dioxygenase-like ring-hydroxylating dioxygenase large terminal subunit
VAAVHSAEVLEVQRLAGAQRPGYGLERIFYTDERVFEYDLERIFKRYWLFVGHESRIPKAGDFFIYEIARESLIIIRGQDGAVRALFNVCRHRGSRVCTEPEGHVKRLVCPYHAWIYENDGRLAHARAMFDDFDKANHGLEQAHVRVWNGLIFISMAREPIDFDQVDRALSPLLAPYHLSDTKIAARSTYLVNANWKVLAENFRECYHCGIAHPQYCRAVAGVTVLPSDLENITATEILNHREEGPVASDRAVRLRPGRWYLTTPYPYRDGFVTESLDGKPVAPPLGEMAGRSPEIVGTVIWPTLDSETSPDYAALMRVTPRAVTTTEVEMNWLVRADAREGVDYDVERVKGFWKATGEQDWQIIEDTQAGVTSDRYRPGPLSRMESDVMLFDQWYLAELRGGLVTAT